MEMYQPEIDRFEQFKSDLAKAVDAEGLKAVFNDPKYADYNRSEFGENLYGKVKDMVSNGAGIRSISRPLDSIINKVFQDHLLGGKFLNGDNLKLVPDIYSKSGEMIPKGEVMITRAKWKALGEPTHILTLRYPINRKTASSSARVLIAEDHGINNLGDNHIIPSLYDTYVNKEGDFDGDTFTVFKIGGDRGIPPKIVDAIENQRKAQGDMLLSPLTSYPDIPIDNANLQEISSKAIQGGEGVAAVDVVHRIMPSLIDNKMRFEISANDKAGYRTASIYSGDKSVLSLKLKGKGDASTITPLWGPEQQKLLSQLSQESTDAMSKSNLSDRLGNGTINDYIYSHLFSGVDVKQDSYILSQLLGKLQTPYRLATKKIFSSVQAHKDMEGYNKITDGIKAGGGSTVPTQDLMSAIAAGSPWDVKELTKNNVAADAAAGEQLNAEYKPGTEYRPGTQTSKKVSDFVNFVTKAKARYFNTVEDDKVAQSDKRQAIRNEVLDYYNAHSSSYTPKDSNMISLFLTMSPKSNFGQDARFPKALFVYRFDELFNNTPDIAKKYYSAFENYVVPPVAPKVGPSRLKTLGKPPAFTPSRFKTLNKKAPETLMDPLGIKKAKDIASNPFFKRQAEKDHWINSPDVSKIKNISDIPFDEKGMSEDDPWKTNDKYLYRGVPFDNISYDEKNKSWNIGGGGYDNMFKGSGTSFAVTPSHAGRYASRYSVSPVIVAVSKNFISSKFPIKTSGGTKSIGSTVLGEEGEYRTIEDSSHVLPSIPSKDIKIFILNTPKISDIKSLSNKELLTLDNKSTNDSDIAEHNHGEGVDSKISLESSLSTNIMFEIAKRLSDKRMSHQEYKDFPWDGVSEPMFY
jgi:hypothetical protein